jgi:hypothetical protein
VGQDTFHFYRPATPDDGFDCSDISAFSRVHDHLDQQPKLTKKGDLERAAPPGRCHSCNRAETPEWRRGPDGARTLCNACGLHYAKLTRKQNNASKNAAVNNSNLRPKENM